MRSLERTLNGLGASLPGDAAIRLLGVALLLGLQSFELGGNIQLLQFRGAWAIQPLCIAMLAAVIGLAGASLRDRVAPRVFLLDTLRLSGPVFSFIVIAALLAGALLTDRPAGDYFSDLETASYGLNLLAWPHYSLPGVFEFNDLAGIVNRNIWIAPFFVTATIIVSLPHRRWGLRFLPAAIALTVALTALAAQALGLEPGGALELAQVALRGDGLSAMIGGLVAAALFRSRRHVPAAIGWRLACLGLLFVLIVVGNEEWATLAIFRIVSAVAVAYITVIAAAYPLPGVRAAIRALPYLLGAYLFSFPLQQTIIQVAPFGRQSMISAAAGLVAAVVLAIAFRFVIGRRVLSERQRHPPVIEIVQGAGRQRRPMFSSRSDAAVHLTLAGLFFIVVLGLIAMVYVAMLPASGAM